MSGMDWLRAMGQRIMQRQPDMPPVPPPASLGRDPDLDLLHIQQHELMNRISYDHLRNSMEERRARLELLDMQSDPRGDPRGC